MMWHKRQVLSAHGIHSVAFDVETSQTSNGASSRLPRTQKQRQPPLEQSYLLVNPILLEAMFSFLPNLESGISPTPHSAVLGLSLQPRGFEGAWGAHNNFSSQTQERVHTPSWAFTMAEVAQLEREVYNSDLSFSVSRRRRRNDKESNLMHLLKVHTSSQIISPQLLWR